MILPKEDYLATQKRKLRLGAKHAQELNLQTGLKPQNLLAGRYIDITCKKNLLTFIAKRKTFIFALVK